MPPLASVPVVLALLAFAAASPPVCAAGPIGDRYGAAVERACLARIGEDVRIEFKRQGTCFGGSTAAAAFFAQSVADSAISYDVSLVDGERGWRVWSVVRRMRVVVPGRPEEATVLVHPEVRPDAARRAIASVMPLIGAAEAIGSVGVFPEGHPCAGRLMVETIDRSVRTPCGRVFSVTVSDERYEARLNGRWIF